MKTPKYRKCGVRKGGVAKGSNLKQHFNLTISLTCYGKTIAYKSILRPTTAKGLPHGTKSAKWIHILENAKYRKGGGSGVGGAKGAKLKQHCDPNISLDLFIKTIAYTSIFTPTTTRRRPDGAKGTKLGHKPGNA